jgi:hypothetical protein
MLTERGTIEGGLKGTGYFSPVAIARSRSRSVNVPSVCPARRRMVLAPSSFFIFATNPELTTASPSDHRSSRARVCLSPSATH